MSAIIWKDVVGYEGIYAVSNIGQVKRYCRVVVDSRGKVRQMKEKVFKTTTDAYGYKIVGFGINKEFKIFKVHRLVGFAFIPNPNNYPEINHLDGVKDNNCVANLEWASSSMNIKHHNKMLPDIARGSNNSNSKLTESEVAQIRKLAVIGTYKKGASNVKELAEQFGVSTGNIYTIVAGKRIWKQS